MESPIVSWLDDEALRTVHTSEYWNRPEVESDKPWAVETVEDQKALHYIREETNLEDAFRAGLDAARAWAGRPVAGTCVDLGAGVCWSSAILAREPDVERVYAVEISRHRLVNIAPLILRQYGAPPGKVVRVVGDLGRLELEDGSVDWLVMVQAFHHAPDVRRLLAEVARVLAPGGMVVISGEKPVSPRRYLVGLLKHNARVALTWTGLLRLGGRLRGRALAPARRPAWRLHDVFPPDPEKGDRTYTRRGVKALFRGAGLELRLQPLQPPRDRRVKATCNYLGRKR